MIPQSYYTDVNINYKKSTPLIGSVPMSVLISKSAASTKEYTSLQQVQSDYLSSTAPELVAATLYFNNGGTDLLIYQQDSDDTDDVAINKLLDTYSNFVWITFIEEKNASELQLIANTLALSTQPLPKYLAQTTNIENATTTLSAQGIGNVALLYSNDLELVPYSAIVIPAYFSGINLNEVDSVKSLIFTKVNGVAVSDVNTTQLTSLVNANWNIVVNLGGRYTILDGGKMVDGQPIHSAWGFALFKQNCENVVVDLLVNKLPYQNSSNVVIENALSGVCNQFVTNGLIGTDRTYNQETQSVNYNGFEYVTIRNGQVLASGYYIYSVPIGNATSADKEIGKIPPIYIYAIINDVIRQVIIIGEVTK